MRPSCNPLARDHITARVRAASLCDTDLPSDLFRPKRKVVTLDVVDHTASEVLRADLRHQLFVGIRHQQIGSWERSSDISPERLSQAHVTDLPPFSTDAMRWIAETKPCVGETQAVGQCETPLARMYSAITGSK
jgi:hypothetical protein